MGSNCTIEKQIAKNVNQLKNITYYILITRIIIYMGVEMLQL